MKEKTLMEILSARKRWRNNNYWAKQRWETFWYEPAYTEVR